MKITWPDNTIQQYEELLIGRRYTVLELETREQNHSASESTVFKESSQRFGLNFTHQESDYDDFQREPLLPYKLSRVGGVACWGNINQNPFPELYCGGAAGQAGRLFGRRSAQANSGENSIEPIAGPWEADAPCEDMGAVFFDADGDGEDDLYVVSGSNEFDANDPRLRDRLYINQDETFVKATDALPDERLSGSCVSVCDFDRDGDLDLFVAHAVS